MSHRPPNRISQALAALGLSVVLASACGGRAVEESAPAGVGASSGAAAGASAGMGASGRASGGSGAVGKAGSASAGAPSGCAKCPPIACDPNSILVFPNGACCPSCVSSCPPCPDIACPSGYQLQTQPGDCCPSCVPTPVDCVTGRQSYATVEMQYADKYKYGCTSAADCVADAPSNACEQGCSYYPISRNALGSWQMNLGSEAAIHCSSCPPTGPVPCPSPPPVTCQNGQCSLAFLL